MNRRYGKQIRKTFKLRLTFYFMVLEFSLGRFYGIDSLLDFAIVVVAFMVSYQGRRVYKILNDRNYKLFSYSFFCIGVAFLLKILVNLTIVHKVIITNPNFVSVIVREVSGTKLINFFSFILYKSFFISGLLILFLIFMKNYKRSDVVLFGYLSVLTILLSIYFNFVFHLTLVVLLINIASYFYENYTKNKSKQSLISFVAFVFILAGNLVDIFYSFSAFIYLFGELLIFAGFVVLFFNHVGIKNEQKKNKT